MIENLPDAIEFLNKVNADFFVHKAISSFDHSRTREAAIANAMTMVAADCGVALKDPLHIDARGDYKILAGTYQKFGEKFAAYLTEFQARTGLLGPNIITETGTWCYLNHFAAEKMVQAYFERNKG